MTTPTPRPVPIRALILSLGSLAVPLLVVLAFPAWMQEDEGLLVWLTCLIPAFLLAYHRGLRGVAVALAAGMAVLSLGQVAIALLGKTSTNWTLLLPIVTVYVAVCIGLAVFSEALHRERRAAEALALIDGLTGLPNRRHAEVTLESQFAAAVRGRKLTVVLFDLDNFKQVNDRHGHDAGDEALRGFAEVIRKNTRRMDLSARFGGEEFISVLSDSEPEHVLIFANRVREHIKAREFSWGRITVSAGLASYQDGMGSHEVLVASADRALYAAKQAGKNCVTTATPIPSGKAPPVAEAVAQPARLEPRGTETVMVIDDDPDVLRAVGRVLNGAGYRVFETDDPEEVLRYFRDVKSRPDLLVADVMMPRMNGLNLVDRIMSTLPEIRVVYLSGYLQRDVSWSGLPGWAVGFVAKPIETGDLLVRVRAVLDQTTPSSAAKAAAPASAARQAARG